MLLGYYEMDSLIVIDGLPVIFMVYQKVYILNVIVGTSYQYLP